ncbi:hypothetical protein BDR07DRAFT_193780 [Suillus spraguei]|nr:hypothetical protein BDR07DRAFT_193780 [Suillus spraguei]
MAVTQITSAGSTVCYLCVSPAVACLPCTLSVGNYRQLYYPNSIWGASWYFMPSQPFEECKRTNLKYSQYIGWPGQGLPMKLVFSGHAASAE